jgi:competence protein ComEC
MLAAGTLLNAAKTLDIYFVDVEGGQATLIVSPSGQSMLVDAGWPGYNGRDADRILAAAKKAGVKKIDYFVVTHFHRDHVGGVTQLSDRIPILNVVDHGKSVETTPDATALYSAYEKVAEKAKRITVKPGDKIPVKDLSVEVISSNGDVISESRPGAGQPNPACDSAKRKEDDPTENARSVGVLVTYGDFRFIDLGDLTWNKELDLVCPVNKIGKVDVYLTTHHGLNASGPAAIVHALAPRVAIMNNGARKGGSPEAFQAVKNSPGLEDLWQLHFAVAGGKENNVPDALIANVDEGCQGQYIKVSATKTGEFTVFNSRNKHQKTYTR